MDISKKSFGFLVDELITAWMKADEGYQDAIARRDELSQCLESNYPFLMLSNEVNKVIDKLKQVSRECFDAQDLIMADGVPVNEVAATAIHAQKCNKQRNQLIRKLDDLAGESQITVLEKTYG